MRPLNGRGAVLLTAAVVLGTPGAVHASARADKTLRLRQDTPFNAAARAGGACPVPADKDGWHFTLAEAPKSVTFESVTATFDIGGTQTVGAGGRDAYVASERGANLTGATAVVDGSLFVLPLVRYFDLADACPGQAPAPQPPPAEQPSAEQPAQDQPQQPDGGNNGQGNGNGPGDQQKPKPGATPASTSPAATPAAAATATTTKPPKVPGGIDQPELQVDTEDGSTPVAVAADESSGGLGIQGFALIATGVFLLVFGCAAAYIGIRRRSA